MEVKYSCYTAGLKSQLFAKKNYPRSILKIKAQLATITLKLRE